MCRASAAQHLTQCSGVPGLRHLPSPKRCGRSPSEAAIQARPAALLIIPSSTFLYLGVFFFGCVCRVLQSLVPSNWTCESAFVRVPVNAPFPSAPQVHFPTPLIRHSTSQVGFHQPSLCCKFVETSVLSSVLFSVDSGWRLCMPIHIYR